MLNQALISVIGGGNMGTSLVGGLIHRGIPENTIWVVEHHAEKRAYFQEKWNVNVSVDIKDVASKVDIIILAIKPNAIKPALAEIAPLLKDASKLLVSIAAGITIAQIQRWINQLDYPVIRAMPNTPALFGHGISGLCASPAATPAQREKAQELLESVGRTVWLQDESLMDVVTALSGSGPAYFFYFMESLINGAQSLGLPKDIASELTLYTAMGSAYMALHSKDPLTILREKVTSPGGTTEQGIKALKNGNIEALLQQALEAANNRGKEISKLYD